MTRALLIAAIAVPLTFLAWLVGLRALARDAGLDPLGLDEMAEPWFA